MAKSEKRSAAKARKAASKREATARAGEPGSGGASVPKRPPAASPFPPRSFASLLLPWCLAPVAAVLAFLGFAGFGIWPLAFVAFVPLFFALDEGRYRRGLLALAVGLFFGFIAQWGGYYWLVQMLVNFSGFSTALCILFASVLIAYTAGGFTIFAVIWAKATERGWSPTLAAVCAFLAVEYLYPLLFPFYYGASFHDVPVLLQTADLGGPLLQSALAISVNAAIFEVLRARIRKERMPRAAPAAVVAFVAFTLLYGGWRISSVDADVRAAEKVLVGIVQTNMGLLQKREDPWEGHRRHVEQSLDVERASHPDLIVWPESAYTWFLPQSVHNVKRTIMGPLSTPILFGGLQQREVDGVDRHFNTAFVTNGEGDVLGSYDKTYLLAFGEYLPFGDWFPQLYDISRHSGHFTRGNHVHPLPFRDYRMATLICYEDILPSFVRRAVSEGNPHVLVNVTNDAWFGDTHEPWIHFALAKFRAVEHRRYLIRSTNSGVSGVIDPVGRVVTQSKTFTRENLTARVAMLEGHTVYGVVGDWPGWLAIAGSLAMLFLRRRAPAGA